MPVEESLLTSNCDDWELPLYLNSIQPDKNIVDIKIVQINDRTYTCLSNRAPLYDNDTYMSTPSLVEFMNDNLSVDPSSLLGMHHTSQHLGLCKQRLTSPIRTIMDIKLFF